MNASLAASRTQEIYPGALLFPLARVGVVVCDPVRLRILYSNARATKLLRYIDPEMEGGRSLQLPKPLAEYCKKLGIAAPSQSDDQSTAGRLVCNQRCVIRFTGITIPNAPGGSRKDILLLLEKEETAAEPVPSIASSALLFTNQQQKVLTFLREGLSNKEIAAQLSLSEYTVKDHLKRIMKKMNCTSRIAVVIGLAPAAPTAQRAN